MLHLQVNNTYLCIDVCTQLNKAFHQWNVAIDRRQVETIVSWEEKN